MDDYHITTPEQLDGLRLEDLPFVPHYLYENDHTQIVAESFRRDPTQPFDKFVSEFCRANPHYLGLRAEIKIGEDTVSIICQGENAFEAYFLRGSPHRNALLALMPRDDESGTRQEDITLTKDAVIPFLRQAAEISLKGMNHIQSSGRLM